MNGTPVATLGEGKFARISCVRVGSSEYRACKTYDRQKSIADGRIERILAEKSVLQMLSNPYIVKYLDTGKDELNLYLYIEAALGGPLHIHIRESCGFGTATTSLYLAQIISALRHMARQGCIHRDLKASNCVLTSRGHLKICDFGSSKSLFHPSEFDAVVAAGVTQCPRTFTVIGTPHCMPPEMLRCNQQQSLENRCSGYGLSVDWWSLGVLLLEMIHGRLPSEDDLAALSISSPDDCNSFCDQCGMSSAETPEVQSAIDLARKLLVINLERRWGIWDEEQVLCALFFHFL